MRVVGRPPSLIILILRKWKTKMFYLEEGDNSGAVEYVDDMWLHCHNNAGMVSFPFTPKHINKFVNFLMHMSICTSEEDGDFRSQKIGKYSCSFNGPDEDKFNVFISSPDVVFLFNIARSRIMFLIAELKKNFQK